MPTKADYPTIDITNVKDGQKLDPSGSFFVKANIYGGDRVFKQASLSIDQKSFAEDDKGEDPLVLTAEGYWSGQLHYENLAPGAHCLRVRFIDDAGKKYYKSIQFGLEPSDSRLVWRSFIDGSCRAAPAVTPSMVYVGGTDRKLYALDKATGSIKWTFPTKGDTSTTPVVVNGTIYFGCGDGKLYALDAQGKEKWSFQAKEAIYSSPVYHNDMLLFGCNDSNFYAVDAKTGQQKWVLEDPGYTIEVRPFVYDGTVYFGAWDTFVYAVDVQTGQLKWKKPGYACTQRTAAVRYYSPADNGPVVTAGKVFIADRDSKLGIMDTVTGEFRGNAAGIVAVGLAEDGKSVYVRKPNAVGKLDLDGKEIWSVEASADSVPASPVERDGIVYVVSRLGLVQALSADDGSLVWSYQATPLLYVFDQVTVADGIVYVSSMDGSVTAIKAK
jgi:outer membrane protein assembly factor BamB